LQAPALLGGSGQDSSQPTCWPVDGEKDMSVEVDLDLQGVIEDTIHKDLLVLARDEG